MKKLLALLCAMAILCSVCVPVLAAEEKVPVVAQVPKGWEIAYLYAWDNGGEMSWPGIPMTALNGYFYAYMSGNMKNVIINNGSGIQTPDLSVQPGVPVFVQGFDIAHAEVAYKLPMEVPGENETPKATVTIHAGVPESWASAYLYAWNDGGSNGAWPGVPMTKGDDGFWTAELLPVYTNVIIAEKDGGPQTLDLTVTGGECWIAFTGLNENGKFEADVTEFAPEDFVPPGSTENPTEPPVEPVADMVVYAKVPAEWTNVRLWIWDENGNPPSYIGAWPGELVMNLEVDGWYSCAIPSKYNHFLINADGDIQTAGGQTVLLVLGGTGAHSNIGQKVGEVAVVLGIEHLVGTAEAVVAQGGQMQITDGDDTLEHIGTLVGIGLVEHALVAVARGAGLVGVNAGDDHDLIGHTVLYTAQSSDVIQHRLAVVCRAGADDEQEFIRFAAEDTGNLLIARRLDGRQLLADGVFCLDINRHGQFSVEMHIHDSGLLGYMDEIKFLINMQETEGFLPQLFILHYSSFIIHYWVYRNDKPKFATPPPALQKNSKKRPKGLYKNRILCYNILCIFIYKHGKEFHNGIQR